jgi:hypothetical protein
MHRPTGGRDRIAPLPARERGSSQVPRARPVVAPVVEPIAARPPVAQRLHPAAIAGPQPIALAVSGETGTHLSRASEPAVVSLAPPQAAVVVSPAPPPAGELVAPAPGARRAMVAPPAADPDDSFAPRVRSASALRPTVSRRRVGWGWWIALAAAAAFFVASAATWMR